MLQMWEAQIITATLDDCAGERLRRWQSIEKSGIAFPEELGVSGKPQDLQDTVTATGRWPEKDWEKLWIGT